MTTQTLITYVLGTLATLGAFIFVVSYGYGKYQEGKAKVKGERLKSDIDEVDLFSSRIDELEKLSSAYKKEVLELRQELRDMADSYTKQMVELRSLIEEKDKKLQEYIGILQGKDPALQHAAEQMIKFIAETNTHMKKEEANWAKTEDGISRIIVATDHIKSVTNRLLGVPGVTPPKV